MTNHLERIEVNGTAIWVEVDDLAVVPPHKQTASGDSGLTSRTASGPSIDEAAKGLARVDLQQTLASLIEPVHQALMASRPKEVSVELSLGIKGEVGFFVAKSEGNASLKITAKWSFDAKAVPAPASKP